MREITPVEASEKYSIRTASHEFEPDGERRFRLLNQDGTGYIRTEYPKINSGNWQEAHYHRSVTETYIIQERWIAFADNTNGMRRVRILKAGEIVTVPPLISHNVYLSPGCVFHTIKHGVACGEDKVPDFDFNAKCRLLCTEQEVVDAATSATEMGVEQIYTEEYRHFDTLIWQLPGWSTAIFLGTAAVLGQASHENLSKLLPVFSVSSLVWGFLLAVFVFLLGLTQALYRFRRHQAPLKKYNKTHWWSSASTYLQVFVTAQAFLVLYVALVVMGLSLHSALLISSIGLVGLSVYRELRLR